MALERDSLLHNRYRILEILGEGGMGAVYKVRDENLGVVVAVKENLFTTEEYARQFRMEATILATLRHPNLTRVTDHFEEGEGQYLVMDYIEGEDLRDRMDRIGILDEEEVIIMGRAICEALTYLHTRIPTILHRDIKPGNVRIAPNGQVFLVDFGLAKIVEGSQLTMTGARAMTPGYSPPEQYGTARTDARSDIYSLGATIYSAITGSLPEDGLARAMNQVTLTPVRKLNPKVSRKLSTIIEKALSVHPDERYQSAEEFQKALTGARGVSRRRNDHMTVSPPPSAILDDVLNFAILDTLDKTTPPVNDIPSIKIPVNQTPANSSVPNLASVDLKPSSSFSRPSLPISKPLTHPLSEGLFETSPGSKKAEKKKPIGCLPIMFLIFLLVGGSVAVTYFVFPEQFKQALEFGVSPAGITQVVNTPSPTGPDSVLITEPVNTPIPETAVQTSTPPPITEIPTDLPTEPPTDIPTLTPTATEIPPTSTPTPEEPTPLPGPTPFAGSGQIVYASAVGPGKIAQLWIADIDGQSVRQLTDIPEGACQPDWSPDGTQIVFISPCLGELDEYPDSHLFLISSDGSGLTQLTSQQGGDFDPDWSPDGSQIVFTSYRGGEAQIFLYTIADESFKLLAEDGIKNLQPSFSADGQKITFISTRTGSFRIWIMNPDGSEQVPFSRSQDWKNVWPIFNLTGDTIIFTQRQLTGGIPRIMLAPLSEDGFDEIVFVDVTIPRRSPSLSPDGAWLAFESWPDGVNHDIFVITLEGQNLIRVTDSEMYDFDPDWRPTP